MEMSQPSTRTEGPKATTLGRVVMVYPRIFQRMEAKMVEWLGSGGSFMMMQEGEAYLLTIAEQLQARFNPPTKEALLALLTRELRDTGWGDYRFHLQGPDKKSVILEGTGLPYDHGVEPTYFWFMMGMLKAVVERAFDAKINIRKTEWSDGDSVRVELDLDGKAYLGPASK